MEQLVDGCLDLFSTYDVFIHQGLFSGDKKKMVSVLQFNFKHLRITLIQKQ